MSSVSSRSAKNCRTVPKIKNAVSLRRSLFILSHIFHVIYDLSILAVFASFVILLLLPPDIFLNGLTAEPPLSTNSKSWQIPLTGKALNCSRVNTEHFSYFIGIKNVLLHYHACLLSASICQIILSC